MLKLLLSKKGKTMKRLLLTLLGFIVVSGLFGAVGYAGYRYGYAQGVQATASGAPQLRPFDDFDPRGMHGFGMDREFQRGFGPGGFPMRGIGFFSPWRWLGPLAVLALIFWFVYWLFTRSGWRLTRTVPVTETPPPPVKTEVKEENQES
jgi:hypothetical protein